MHARIGLSSATRADHLARRALQGNSMKIRVFLACMLALVLAACGGTKLVRKPAPLPERAAPLAAASDARLSAELQFVIVRNGPAAWAKNADWDEYLLGVRNVGSAPLSIHAVAVTDSQGQVNGTQDERRNLVAASKQATRRYRDAGLKVEAGRGGTALIATGVGAGVVAYGAATAAAVGSALGAGGAGAAGGGAAAAAGGLILAAPVLIGVGIMRAVNNGKVNDRIEDRATSLPLTLAPGAEATLDVFFPLSPSPQQVVVHYQDGQGTHRLEVDTRQVLAGLHLSARAASK